MITHFAMEASRLNEKPLTRERISQRKGESRL